LTAENVRNVKTNENKFLDQQITRYRSAPISNRLFLTARTTPAKVPQKFICNVWSNPAYNKPTNRDEDMTSLAEVMIEYDTENHFIPKQKLKIMQVYRLHSFRAVD